MVQLIFRYAGRTLLRAPSPRSRSICQTSIHRAKSNADHVAIQRKWQQQWKKEEEWAWLTNAAKKWTADEEAAKEKMKMYILPMFPYPSGDLHMGHMRVYTISDVLSRFRRMQGYDVLHPIGWDAFGLPAENAAIERGIEPKDWTTQNIERMKGQLQAMNCEWNWDREFKTCDPEFYKHTQRLFLLLHGCGLAYQAESLVNYDPIDKTVLANEQVDANGLSWRSGAKVEKRMLKQWFLKISEFREELLADLDLLEGAWPERVLAMQKNWLGRSTGARIKFPVIAHDQKSYADIEVFTTRPDTLFGVQYVALASTHPIVQELAKNDVELQAFLDSIPTLPSDSKIGYLLPNVRAVNPLAYEESTPDATKASLPVYIAPYVLGDYGDGAVMGVPGHDNRDHAFWKYNCDDKRIRMVIAQSVDESSVASTEPFVYHGKLTSLNGPYSGLTTEEATRSIIELLESKGLGSASETWRLRDWLVSRQRYWGTPIPIIHCDSCGPVPVPTDQLPVELPSSMKPLESNHAWINTDCPKCGSAAKRDTDTMDTFVDSSWYFMRFIDPRNEDQLFDPSLAEKFLPVDLYVGGVEHAILHLLYARFISKFLAAASLWKSTNNGEPFKQLLAQGMVHGKTYSDPSNGRFLKPHEVDLSIPSKPVVVSSGEKANVSFEKMSKSKYNGVDPMACMETHSPDATRAHILFQAPVSEVLEWDEEKITGITRWFQRIYDHIDEVKTWFPGDPAQPRHEVGAFNDINGQPIVCDDFNAKDWLWAGAEIRDELDHVGEPIHRVHEHDKKLWRAVQKTVMRVTEAYSSTYALNTVISDLMALTKSVSQEEASNYLRRAATIVLVQLLAPIAPATAEECWTRLQSSRGSMDHLSDDESGSVSGLVLELLTIVSKTESIFDLPFPEPDGTYDLLAPENMTCAVQVNGKLRFTVEIPTPSEGLKGEELKKWIMDEIMSTEEGGRRLVGPLEPDKIKKVIVVRGGKTVNFVI